MLIRKLLNTDQLRKKSNWTTSGEWRVSERDRGLPTNGNYPNVSIYI